MRTDDAYAEVRRLVLSGEIGAGDRLTELDLAARLGMSRTPIREALRRLEAEGFVSAAGRGVVVAGLDDDALVHAYRMRAALERLCAELAAERVRDGEVAPVAIRRLRELAAGSAAAVHEERLLDALTGNRAFHLHVAEIAANPLALDALDRLWDRIFVSTRASLAATGDRDAVIADQARLVDAIADGDPERAGPLARDHVLAALAEARARSTSGSA